MRPVPSSSDSEPVACAPRRRVAARSLGRARRPGASDATEERFEKTYDLAGIRRSGLQNVNGPVQVETWDKPELRLVAVKTSEGLEPGRER